ncbi:MrcB family domain-containing protein [Cetobacterium sp.]|uniref:MrcB family domain-containing protein n=1 Tax=Cetobacterium sp. TaxID=2071632 RepID=UPI003EE7FBA0
MEIIKENFKKILNEYLIEKQKTFGRNKLAIFIRETLPNRLVEKGLIDLNKYKIIGSSGQGVWAAVPWIGIFDKDITISAQSGYYLVYLFDENMNKFYLSLNQGWTYYKTEFGKKIGSKNIKIVSEKLRKKLVTLSDTKYSEVKSIDLGKGELAQGYELGHICGVEYSLDKIPNDKDLINDLRDMMMIYLELKKSLKNSNFSDVINNLILDDNLFIENEDEMISEIENAELVQEKKEPTPKLPPRRSSEGLIWPRDAKVSKLAIDKANYLCENDSNHISFTSDITKKLYMEAHHLIPINFQEEFDNSLDVSGNIVSLCPNCHRKIHHGVFEDKKAIIQKLYNERKEVLQEFGLHISLENLLRKYL